MLLALLEPGTLAQWLTLVGIIAAGWILLRGGGGGALASLETANRVLEKRVHDLEQQAKLDQATIGELRGRTDVTLALQPLSAEIANHEAHAQARADRALIELRRIADHLDARTAHD